METLQKVLSFSETSKILGFTPSAGYVARKRGHFPVRVRQIGKKLVCFKSDIDLFLQTGESQAGLSVPTIPKPIVKKRVGRPRKAESLKAEGMGITVHQLRAQMGTGGAK